MHGAWSGRRFDPGGIFYSIEDGDEPLCSVMSVVMSGHPNERNDDDEDAMSGATRFGNRDEPLLQQPAQAELGLGLLDALSEAREARLPEELAARERAVPIGDEWVGGC